MTFHARYSYLIVLIFSLVISAVSLAQAQSMSIPVSIGGLELSASTDNPTPGQMVTITAVSYSADVNASTITWTSGGKILQSGIGATTLSVKAPDMGQKMTISVVAVTPEGRHLTNSISITSGSVDMILEPDGYVPPLFNGKLPVSYQNSVTLIAVPHIADSSGVEYDPHTLIYQWKQSDRLIDDQSGYGKQSITLPGSIVPRAFAISVDVSSKDGNSLGHGMISIVPQQPSLNFYLNDSLYGPLFNRAVKGLVQIGSAREANILAVPFGFNMPKQGIGDLKLTWLINGTEHQELASNESVVLRAPDAAAGSSVVELDLQNTNEILQSARNGFSAAFSAQTTGQKAPITF